MVKPLTLLVVMALCCCLVAAEGEILTPNWTFLLLLLWNLSRVCGKDIILFSISNCNPIFCSLMVENTPKYIRQRFRRESNSVLLLKTSVNPESGLENWNILATFAAFSGCHCLGTVKKPVPYRVIKKIEMVPISGHCRRPETMWVSIWAWIHEMTSVLDLVTRKLTHVSRCSRLTRKNGFKMCIDPNQKWFKVLLSQIQKWFHLTFNDPFCRRVCWLARSHFRVLNDVFPSFPEAWRQPEPPPLPPPSDFLPSTAGVLPGPSTCHLFTHLKQTNKQRC